MWLERLLFNNLANKKVNGIGGGRGGESEDRNRGYNILRYIF